MAKGLLINLDGSTEFREITSYLDIREAVGGDFDWTAPTLVTYYVYKYSLFEMPINPVATVLYGYTHPEAKDPLAGPVLVVGPPVNEDDTDIPQNIVDLVEGIREKMGQDEINRLAVPLTPKAQMDLQMQMIAEQGQSVDFGGILLSRDVAEQFEPSSDIIDGQHRTET